MLAADAGYLACRQAGVVPDLLLGDFDSMDQPEDFDRVRRMPVEKDDTDTMLAVKTGLEQGCGEFYLYGGTGGRVDHTLANLQSLVWLSTRGGRGFLVGENWTAAAITDGSMDFPADRRGTLSVFCQGDRAEGVTLEGLKYPLKDAVLTCDFPLGVSNSFTGAESRVSVEKGTLLLVWYEGGASPVVY